MADTTQQSGDSGPPKGLPAFLALCSANKVDVAMWAIRVLTVIFTFGYMVPIFNNPTSAFQKALLANAAVSALRLHQRIPAQEIALSQEFFNRFILEDSTHYLFYSLFFLDAKPNLLILIPIFLFAVLHAASYSLTILDTLGHNSLWVARLLISLVEFQSRNILRLAALAEVILFPVTIIMVLAGQCSLMTPLLYYYVVAGRYCSRRNPYTRNTLKELRGAAERVANHPRCPGAVSAAVRGGVRLVCCLEPSQHAQAQQQQQAQ